MTNKELALIRKYDEFVERGKWNKVPHDTRGIYALLKKRRGGKFDVVYVGMTASGIRGRLRQHAGSRSKKVQWNYFSVFEVHPYVSSQTIEELEGLLRHVYRKDTKTNSLNLPKGFKELKAKRLPIEEWESTYSLHFTTRSQTTGSLENI